MQEISDKKFFAINGFIILPLLILLGFLAFFIMSQSLIMLFTGAVLFIAIFILASGFVVINPNEAVVLTFFGKYIGTINDNGFLWSMPLTSKYRISLKVINFSTGKLKVNDANGNPIEIVAVIAWKVVDAAKARFSVDNHYEFAVIQSETAVRALASSYPYDAEPGKESLRGNTEAISEALKKELDQKLTVAGVNIIEARLSHLSYASEIATAMLKRQQAEAIISARKYIVDNALTIVSDVLERLEKEKSLKMSDDKKCALINNLIVALVAEQDAQPIINLSSS